jgi:hypothetical protein
MLAKVPKIPPKYPKCIGLRPYSTNSLDLKQHTLIAVPVKDRDSGEIIAYAAGPMVGTPYKLKCSRPITRKRLVTTLGSYIKRCPGGFSSLCFRMQRAPLHYGVPLRSARRASAPR